MCNRYWDLYECRWQEFSSQQVDSSADVASVPQPRTATPSAPETAVPVPATI